MYTYDLTPGTGTPGADGASAYEVAVANGFVGTEVEWLASLEGTPGAPGADGLDGAQGPQGDPGVQGDPGMPGDSAYEVAVADGFVGNEAAWLASLVGAQGVQGIQGIQGISGEPGTPGADGADGVDGLSAYEVAVANGFVGTEAEWLASLVGYGVDGLSAYEVAVANGFVGDETAWLASLVGPQGIQGIQGVQGIQGEQGIQGLQGIQGIQGEPGADGADALWNFTGAYSGGAAYAVGDVATYDGRTWYRINSNGGNVGDTPAEGIFWTLLAEKGDQGEPGTTFAGYDREIHVSAADGSDVTGNGDLLNPVASITQALTLVTSVRKTIVVHPGTYTENPSITTQYTVITAPGLLGGNTQLIGTLSTNTGCTISGLKVQNVTVTTPAATGNVNILNCDIYGTLTKSSNADYVLVRLCDVAATSITGSGTVAVLGGNPVLVTVNHATANVLIDGAVAVSPTLTAGSLNITDSVVVAAATYAVTSAASSVITLANSQFVTSALTAVAPISLSGFYSITNCLYDKPTSVLVALSGTGGPANTIDYFQYINADGFITQGGTSADYVKGDGSLSSVVPTATSASSVVFDVKNDSGVTLIKGTPVYATGANGTNLLVEPASNLLDITSATVIGLLNVTLAPNDIGPMTQIGLLENINTNTAVVGDPVWLGATAGTVLYGYANKPYAPNHLVYLGIVSRVSATVGSIDVNISNGWELEELHNVAITGAPLNDGDVLKYDGITQLWEAGNAVWLGHSQNYFIDGTTGNNTTGDGTAARPWATLDNALSVTSAVSGTKIYNLGRGVYTSTTLASWPANIFIRGLGGQLTTLSITGAVTLASGWNSGSAGAPPVSGAIDLVISASSGTTFDFFATGSLYGRFALLRTTWAGAFTYNASTAANVCQFNESAFTGAVIFKGPGAGAKDSDFLNTVAINEPNSTNLTTSYNLFFTGNSLRSTLSVNVTANQAVVVDMRSSVVSSNVTVNGANATLWVSPSTVRSASTITITNSGTIDYTANSTMVKFVHDASSALWTGQSANWNAFPDTIYAALTELASRINALEP